MPNAILSQTELKLLFDYDPETGTLAWRIRPAEHFKREQDSRTWNARFAGKAAGCVGHQGYLSVMINGNLFYAHRIIYKIIHDEEPDQIDHINGIRDCNRETNIRAASHQTNLKNKQLSANNTSGVMGVYLHKPSGKWHARIGVNGKHINLGLFSYIEDAAEARRVAEIKYGFHPNHGRAPKI